MKLSVKVNYACRVLAQMARGHGRTELWHIGELAATEAIPANYLAQILAELRNAGFIISKRGKHGGYALARSPEEISLHDIVKALDPEMLEFDIGGEGESGQRVREVWQEVQRVLEAQTRKITFDSLGSSSSGAMYYI